MKTAVIGLGIAVLAYLVLVPLVLLIQRAARRRRASAPADRVQLAWRLATEHAGGAGVSLPVYLTLNETAERLAVAMPTTGRGSGHGPDHGAHRLRRGGAHRRRGGRREEGSAAVSAEAARRQQWSSRLLAHFDIRRVRQVRASRLVAGQGPG